ncbi:sigma-70 family RNA polymerase sigma factor [Aquibacillus koreensis]|uniref:Sigma-70 family RNA polymerase sigma factor n=1 Tax=Aquibacillus koreensis TaxID=279446 RepID=A0A9X3WR05_9BACI|nr:sigma-70 family RNA polymerase sigma factor [Aquibacillus koreensis]MCT2534452.1 sigma-70 family RNA polymerase sigma factor [Aquibacillus koreensis]MDC3421759.1 sigma-70 family RNA polymerase sigma factor [Aquibacillus koreensis]
MNDTCESRRMMLQIADGSKQAFDLFYETHHRFVLQIAYKILGDRVEAEDVCHDIFLEVFQKSNEYSPSKGSVKAWLAIKTKSRCLDRLRKKKPVLVNKLEAILNQEVTAVDSYVLSQIERDILLDALQHIPEKQREVIYEAYFNGRTHMELADLLHIPLGSVKSIIRYGINNLRKHQSLVHWMNSSGGEK